MMRAAAQKAAPGSADELTRVLLEAQLLLLRHPIAMQALLRSLLAEGRQFAQTATGKRWQARLEESDLVRRGRMLWQGSLLNVFEERGETVLPSALLDALLGVLSADDMTDILSRLLQPEDNDESAGIA